MIASVRNSTGAIGGGTILLKTTDVGFSAAAAVENEGIEEYSQIILKSIFKQKYIFPSLYMRA